ncbi:unnamed protein product [Oikopleura dioica]|uniref:Plasminogen n=1 Tax=Oikopleura dioica TaxID=34765 RepID=E4YVT7_OIKDI|nr:unnamed protein product [Oikopleura dioica]
MQIIGNGSGMNGFPFQKPSKGGKEFKQTSCPPRSGLLPREYHGTLSTSASGRKCQKWNVQQPHHHDKTPEEFPDKNLGDHNYCRNPDDDINGAWCFTEDPNLRWEYCDNTDFACNECMFDNGGCKEIYECLDTNRLKEDTVICRLPETTTEITTYTTTYSTPTTEFSTKEEKDLRPRIVDQGETCGMPKVPAAFRKKITCGGTIISQKFGLTAAHCIGGNYADNSVYAGVFNIKDLTKKDKDLSQAAKERIFRTNIRRYFVPQEYDQETSDEHDIAVLEFENPLEYTNYIQPACLPTTRPGKQQWCEVAGWGATRKSQSLGSPIEFISGGFPTGLFQQMFGGIFGGRRRRESELKQDTVQVLAKDRSQKILTANLHVVDQEKCHKTYQKMFTNNMFCAKSDNGADTCQGDSGGPFMCENADGAWTVSGITSWGRGCAIDGYPGVYTSVVKYLDWIIDVQNDKVKPIKKPHLQDGASQGVMQVVEIPMFSFFGRD